LLNIRSFSQSQCAVIRGQKRAKCRVMTLDEVAKIDKELLGARSEAAITEELGATAAIGA
jgi:hypothetical protein